MPEPTGQITHIAGLNVHLGTLMRQRCAWCGAILGDYDLGRIMVPEGQNPMPPSWLAGDLVVLDGAGAWTIPHEDGALLPDNACARLDPAVTV